jgi:hypothetical protein
VPPHVNPAWEAGIRLIINNLASMALISDDRKYRSFQKSWLASFINGAEMEQEARGFDGDELLSSRASN